MKNFLEDIKAGRKKEVEWALKEEARLVNSRDPSGVSAILIAVYNGQDEIAELLAEAKSDLDVFEAAALGRVDRLRERLDADPDLAQKHSPDGFSALGLAAFFGRLDALRLLIERGADPSVPSDNPMRVTPLHSAVANRDAATSLAMSQALVDADAAINAAQAGGWTPLHQAAAHGREEIVRLLLEHGADPATRSDDERTPADMASERGHASLLPLLQTS